MIWGKFVCNVAFSGTCTLTGLTIGEVLADPDAWSVASACAGEATPSPAPRASRSRSSTRPPTCAPSARKSAAPPSMLLDHLARRPSEIDVLKGAVPCLATEVGLTAPVNATVAALVRARERGS